MGFDRRFTLVLVGWAAGLTVALAGLAATLGRSGFGAVRLVAAVMVAVMLAGLVDHVRRTNVIVARFVEALTHRDFQARVDTGGGAGFDALGQALSGAMQRIQVERMHDAEELRFWQTLVDDVPVALLVSDAAGVRPANKAARRLFDRHEGSRPEDLAVYGQSLIDLLGRDGPVPQEIVPLRIAGATQRAIVRAASLVRLGAPVRVVTVEPVQSAFDAVEVGAQADLVRVFTHEILNSLTPVTSLAGTAAVLLGEEEPDIAAARLATETLARRAEGLRRFVDSYRSVTRLPEPRRRRFAAAPFAAELERLFGAEWLDHRLELEVTPGLELDADPDLLAQALINLLRNAAQASENAGDGGVVLLQITNDTNGMVIAVEDNGPGIAEAARGSIFLPFFTTRPNGTGIGLSLVRQIAVAHGWTIEVRDSMFGGAAIRLSA